MGTREEPPEPGTLSISYVLGFGYCLPGAITEEADGARLLYYHYLPPALWRGDEHAIVGAINAAGKLGFTNDAIPFEDVPEDVAPTNSLTWAGKNLIDRLPLYGILRAKEPWLEWTQYMPDGKVARTVRSGSLSLLLDNELSQFPQNRWAQKFFEPWSRWLPKHSEFGPIAMGMAPPLQGKIPESKQSEPQQEADPEWSTDFDIPRASTEERVESPRGLWKVALVSCHPDQVAHFKKNPTDQGYQFLEGAIGHLDPETDSFTWSQHYFHRWEMPATLMPRVLAWADRDENHDGEDWAAREVVACYEWSVPHVTLKEVPYGDGWARSILLFKPLESCELSYLAVIEAEVRKHGT
jgi:hypothetical protein